MDVVHTVPRSCLCCSPTSSALIPALLSSSNTMGLSACLIMPGGAATAARPSSLSCCSLGWSRARPWPPGPSAAPTPGPAPAPTTTSGASSCFWVMAGFFKPVNRQGEEVISCMSCRNDRIRKSCHLTDTPLSATVSEFKSHLWSISPFNKLPEFRSTS